MKATDKAVKNPLRCPHCDDYRYLLIKGVRFEDENKKVGFKVPFYECLNCDTSSPIAINSQFLHDQTFIIESFYKEKAKEAMTSMKSGETIVLSSPFQNKTFVKFDSLGFKYDSQDYFYIPGLYRERNEGALCPVFFDKEVLLYYNNHSDFRVIFSSYSRMHIINKDGDSIIRHGFGINRNGLVICWLGDLFKEFSKPENQRNKNQFLTFNVDSDHDIVSDYYFNQIEANFLDSDNELKVFELRNKFDEKVIKTIRKNLTRVNLNKLTEDYKHPILNEIDQINNSYIKLNSILIESFDIQNLKDLILETGKLTKDIKGLKGLKLFEAFVQNVLLQTNSSSIVKPLYVLYDLRILAGHIKDSDFNEKLNFCKERLNLSNDSTEIEVFNKLIKDLIEMYERLNRTID